MKGFRIKRLFQTVTLAALSVLPVRALEVGRLQTLQQRNPIGIDQQPTFSWVLSSEERGVVQTAYLLQISRDKDFEQVEWESGLVESDQTLFVPVDHAFQPSTRYYWRVTVRDNKGNETTSTDDTFFETGLMNSGWSGARWIKMPVTNKPSTHYAIECDMTLVAGNICIIFAHQNTYNLHMWGICCRDQSYPVIRRHVYRDNQLTSSDTRVTSLTKDALLSTRHRYKVEVDGRTVKTYIDGVLADTYTSNADIPDGSVGFRMHSNDVGPCYIDNVVVTDYATDGTPHVRLSEDFESDDYQFEGNVEATDDTRQLYFTAINGGEWRYLDTTTGNARCFRRNFQARHVRSAKLYSTALGVYDVFLNGQRVGHLQPDGSYVYDELKPGWTDYAKRVFYNTFDVTELINEGENTIAAMVTPGYWAGDISFGRYGRKELAFRCKLLLTYDDGTSETVVTDNTWKASDNQCLRRCDIYQGERYDARFGLQWLHPDYDDASWQAATLSTDFTGEVSSFQGPAVRIRHELMREAKTVRIYEGVRASGTTYGSLHSIGSPLTTGTFSLKKGQTAVIDYGQNIVGWPAFHVEGRAGCRMLVRLSEMLNETGEASRGNDGPGGSPYLINLRTARAILRYTLSGEAGGERFRPAHTYYGFRYVEITATDDITIHRIVGEVVGSEVEEHSTLTTSNANVNQLLSNILWGQRGNFIGVPTDCPQRDERLGWTGDAQVFCRTAMYNANVAAFFHKYMGDMRDSQNAEGAFPNVAPICWGKEWGAGAWADCGIILPWTAYLMYGDRSILQENYAAMERYMDWLATRSGEGYKYQGGVARTGDHVAYATTEKRYVSVCYYAYDALLMVKISRALSQVPDDAYARKAERYEALYQDIRTEFAKRYINASTQVPNQTTQTGYLLALKMGLCPDEDSRKATIKALEADLTANNETLTTGFIGTSVLNTTLTDVGLNDKAYNLLLQTNCPSWLYSVQQGATTIWERWNSYTKDGGLNKSADMNSFNHYAFGCVGEWIYRYAAGIETDEAQPGFKHIILQPRPDMRRRIPTGQKRLSKVDAKFASPYGDICSQWTLANDRRITYSTTIPANTTATLHLPLVAANDNVTVEGKEGENDSNVVFLGIEDNHAIYELASGTYTFRVTAGTSALSNTKTEPLHVTPNPTTGLLSVSSTEPIQQLRLFDAAGNAVLTQENPTETLNISHLPAGLYILCASTTLGGRVARIIKK